MTHRFLTFNWFTTSLLVALFPPLLQLVFDRDATWYSLRWSYLLSLVYSNSIGWPLQFVTVRCIPLFQRFGLRAGVPLYLAALVVFAFLGTLSGTALICLSGLLRWSVYWALFRDAIRMSLLLTIAVGIGGLAWGVLQTRLEESNAKLRAKEEEERRIRELATEARLASLESRVHPHFLFNAINAILSLIREDPLRAEQLLERMAAFLRYSLDQNQRRLVPLEQELRSVRDYLEIEQARFGSRLRYTIDADPAMLVVPVPPLSIQSLVENSVKYVVTPRREGASIAVSVRSGEILVEDDGPGFDGSALPAGHGLELLQSRLHALFGAAGSLAFERSAERMTVRMRVPARAASL